MIRKANIDDMPEILRIYSAARQFMMENGNPTQWGESYPQKSILLEDIICGQLFIEEIEGKAHGVFAFILGEDPSYHAIVDGEWLSDSPYGTIHRVASDGRAKGFMKRTIDFCSRITPHLRIDTHENNGIMQHLIIKNGFTLCGTIFVSDGSPRIAYEKLD